MSEHDALRHLTDAKSESLFLGGFDSAGYVLYRAKDRSYAVVVLGRVRYFTTEQLMSLLTPSEAA